MIVVAAAGVAIVEAAPRLFKPTQVATVTPPAPAVPVSVAMVERRDTTIWTEFSGRTEAVGRVEIRPRVAGAITETHFREGALVRQGDPLFTIDPAPYAAEVARLEAQVTAASARLVLAANQQQRGFGLVGTGAMPRAELDQRVNEFNAAEANLRGTRAALAATRLNLTWTDVRAPITGRVGKIEVTPGNLVGAGPAAPVLTTLVSTDPIYASFEADERSVAGALASLPASGDLGDQINRIPVEMETLTDSGTMHRGRLQLIDNVVDARSGTVRMRAVFDNPDGRLIPGQFARLRLGHARPEPIVAIDERAVGTDQDRRFVLVVNGDDTVAYREVHLGGTAGGLRIVESGLLPGERIVVNGLHRVRPGARVAPQAVAMTPFVNVALTAR